MLSLALIGKDEVKDLKKLLSSVEGIFDEIVLVTNNSHVFKDVPGIKVVSQDWKDDFSYARNRSFAECTGDFIMWLDLDDTVKDKEVIPTLVEKMLKKEIDWLYSDYIYAQDEHGNVTAIHNKPRIIKRDTGTWQKTIHEDLVPTVAVTSAQDVDLGLNLQVVHKQKTEKQMVKSAERNLKYLLAEFQKDGENTDLRTVFYIGLTLYGLHEWGKAIPYFQKHIEKTGMIEDSYWSLLHLSRCFKELGDLEMAINCALESLKIKPQWSLGYFRLGEYYNLKGDYETSAHWIVQGLNNEKPKTMANLDELDFTLRPYEYLAHDYLMIGRYRDAYDVARRLMGQFGEMKEVKDLFDLCTEAAELEKFKRSFLNVATTFRNEDRQKAAELFNILPEKLADDRDIQQLRSITVPPKVWGDKSIVIYCGGGTPDAWAYPSIFSGIGGSEEAVIYLSRELAKHGYEVTVYNRCGSMDGEYDGVKYVPYHHFSVRDSFNIIIGWRNPYLFSQSIAAKKKYIWFHDIVQPVHLNDLIINNVNKILFLSEWHSKNVPVPEDKIYITNNGINVEDMTVGEKTGDLIWSSSYDRGLLPFVKNIFPAILKEYPDVKLHVAYGWQNIDKELEKVPALAELKHELAPILENHPNIVHHGRLPHAKLHELMSTCSIYPYASEFGETNNITSQKMQASGVYVVTTAQAGGTPERIIFGDVIDAPEIYTNKESQQKYTQALLKAMKTKHKPKDVSEFDWKVTAQAWVKDLL